jgi:methionyl-tRNA synthetase
MIQRTTGELANGFGNLAQRALSMIAKNWDGKVPQPGALTEVDRALLDRLPALLETLRREFDVQAFHRGLEAVWSVVGEGNRYIADQAPWTVRKTDPERAGTVLWVVAETVRRLSILMQPVMPQAMAKTLEQLAVAEDARSFDRITDADALVPGTLLPAPEGVFPRYVEPEAMA